MVFARPLVRSNTHRLNVDHALKIAEVNDIEDRSLHLEFGSAEFEATSFPAIVL